MNNFAKVQKFENVIKETKKGPNLEQMIEQLYSILLLCFQT